MNYFTSFLKTHALLLTLIACVSLLLLSPHIQRVTSTQYVYNEENPALNKAYWKQQIGYSGASKAYAEFLERNNAEPQDDQHVLAHIIGEALYQELGIDGITICDDAFSFGCYHGFSTFAIVEGGEDALRALSQTCDDNYGPFTGCQHGLGHGIMEYVGYEHIEKALAMCNQLVSQPVPLLGCTSGVFMEYLSPLAGGADALQPVIRSFDPEHPYTPCTEVAEEFQDSCYFELGQWLRQTEGVSYGAVCGGLSGVARSRCFMGVGLDLERGWNSAEILIQKCARYAPDDELSCRAGAAWSLVGGEQARVLCRYADETLAQQCRTLADLTSGLDPAIQDSLR